MEDLNPRKHDVVSANPLEGEPDSQQHAGLEPSAEAVQQSTPRDFGATLVRGTLEAEGTVADGATEDGDHKTLPPVESIPSLFELGVKGPDSLHQHKYDQTNTVWAHVSKAEDTPKSERTPGQVELMDDVKRLEAYAFGSGYMDVFTPDELHALAGKLDILRQKNRPDFNSIEAKIIDVVIRNKDEIGGDIVGIARRAEQNSDGRRGMQWATLNKLAAAANNTLAYGMYKGDDRRRYMVEIDRDPDYDRTDKKSVDMQPVYQFVATSHAFDMHGERSVAVREKRLETFAKNYDVITKWYEETKAVIDLLPADREFADSLRNDDDWNRRRRPARSGIQFTMTKLMETMKKRYEGTETSGKFKSYVQDPAGAINLQLLIAHRVEAIRGKLGAGIHPDDLEITPLDESDF